MTQFAVTVNGQLEGLVACESPAQHGPLSFREDGKGHVLFQLALAVSTEDEAQEAIEIAPSAIAAMCAISWGVWVRARPSDWSVQRPDGTQSIGKSFRLDTRVRVDLSMPPSMTGGREAFEAALHGDQDRILVLLNLLGLGLRATQSADYVSGLWAFSTVIEEEAPRGKNNIDHARAMADELRSLGFDVPKNPGRHPSAIRASALHPTPKSPLPTFDEVRWLIAIARAHLASRLASSHRALRRNGRST